MLCSIQVFFCREIFFCCFFYLIFLQLEDLNYPKCKFCGNPTHFAKCDVSYNYYGSMEQEILLEEGYLKVRNLAEKVLHPTSNTQLHPTVNFFHGKGTFSPSTPRIATPLWRRLENRPNRVTKKTGCPTKFWKKSIYFFLGRKGGTTNMGSTSRKVRSWV